jgi:hypothetical protein
MHISASGSVSQNPELALCIDFIHWSINPLELLGQLKSCHMQAWQHQAPSALFRTTMISTGNIRFSDTYQTETLTDQDEISLEWQRRWGYLMPNVVWIGWPGAAPQMDEIMKDNPQNISSLLSIPENPKFATRMPNFQPNYSTLE